MTPTPDDQAEARLRQPEAESRMLIDQVPDLFLVLDRDLTIQDVNRRGAEELGYARKDLLGVNFAVVFADHAAASALFRPDQLRADRPFALRCELRRADGRCQLHRLRATPLADGRVVVIAYAEPPPV